jgi:hydroxypyruvate isomerase
MPRFAANLTMLFTELPFLDRFEAARAAGFSAVEYLFPYDFPKAELAARLRANGLKQVLHNLPAGDWAAGERGIACHPDRVNEFRAGLDQAIAYAHALDCPQLNCLAGKVPQGVTHAAAEATLRDNLAHAASRLGAAGLRLLVEPINPFDIPGFFLTHTAQALALMDEVGSGHLLLQYDLYHAQRTEGELAGTLQRHLPGVADVERVLFADGGVAQGLTRGQTVVDCSVMEPQARRRVAARIEAQGCAYIHASAWEGAAAHENGLREGSPWEKVSASATGPAS